ncbi:hypothetical protein HYV56_02440 [Candidatus Peregrinibacteria bacterium]|nr:hypothetical protein [Candidatus Peregrinibacteria bacterium]
MELKVQFEFLFLGRSEEGFVKNYFYELDEDDQVENAFPSGKIFLTLEMVNNLALGEEIGELIFHTLKTYFFRNFNEDPYLRFEETLKAVNKEVSRIQEERGFKFMSNLNVIVAAIVKDELFLSQAGDSEAYLIRRKHVSVVSEGLNEGGIKNDFFLNIASGTLERNDSIVFSSTRLLRYLTKSELGNIFSENNLVSSLQKLKDLLATEIHTKTGILGIKVEKVAISQDVQEPSLSFPRISLSNFKGVNAIFQPFEGLSHFFIRFKQAFKSFRSFGRDRILIIFALVFIILIVGVYNVKRQSNAKTELLELEAKLTEVQTLISSAETKGTFDKDTAKVLLQTAEGKALEVLNSNQLRAKTTQLLEQIQSQRDTLDNIIHVKDHRIIADLSTKNPNIETFGMIPTRDALFVYTTNLLYQVVLNVIQDPVTIDENDRIKDAAYFDDRDTVVFLTDSARVIEYKDGHFSLMDTDDTTWHAGDEIHAYSGRLYLLSSTDNQIFRYDRRRDSYSRSQPYISNGNVRDVLSFAIDGNVYTLNKDGSIMKFYKGESQTFEVRKSPLISLSEPTKIYTELDLNQLYVLEAAKKRVLIYNKDINSGNLLYSAQYVFDDLEPMRDFYVDKTSNKMYLLSTQKVYEVSL